MLFGIFVLLLIDYLLFNHTERYRHHIRMGTLNSKAFDVNEDAYEMLESIEQRYFDNHKPVNPASTIEMWKLREQARMVAEETVLSAIVYHHY